MSLYNIKLKDITISNIIAYLEGNFKFYLSLLKAEPLYIQEQRLLRFHVCEDCLKNLKCKKCFCDVPERMFTSSNCKDNVCCEWPSLMDEQQWNIYKKVSKIDVSKFKQIQIDALK